MNISLLKFLQTGWLGQLHLGMSVEDVVDLLGVPEHGDLTRNGEPIRTGTYGTCSLSFWDTPMSAPGLTAITWTAQGGEAQLPASCTIKDWEITSGMKPLEVKVYLKDNGLIFQKHSSKGYFERKPVSPRMSPEEAYAAQEMGYLVFRKPKNAADIVRETRFTQYSLASGVGIHFVDEQLVFIMIHSEI